MKYCGHNAAIANDGGSQQIGDYSNSKQSVK